MRVIAISTLKKFWTRHPDSDVDYVNNQRYVFNIKGNEYRLVAAIKFTPKLVYIRFVGTHQEYERIEASCI